MKANFTLSDGDKAVTDADGKAKVTLKGTKAGAHTVTASMVGGKSEQLVVNFTADTLTAQVNLNVTEDNFIANNIGMTRLQAIVTSLFHLFHFFLRIVLTIHTPREGATFSPGDGLLWLNLL